MANKPVTIIHSSSYSYQFPLFQFIFLVIFFFFSMFLCVCFIHRYFLLHFLYAYSWNTFPDEVDKEPELQAAASAAKQPSSKTEVSGPATHEDQQWQTAKRWQAGWTTPATEEQPTDESWPATHEGQQWQTGWATSGWQEDHDKNGQWQSAASQQQAPPQDAWAGWEKRSVWMTPPVNSTHVQLKCLFFAGVLKNPAATQRLRAYSLTSSEFGRKSQLLSRLQGVLVCTNIF